MNYYCTIAEGGREFYPCKEKQCGACKEIEMNSQEKYNEMSEGERRARVIAQNGSTGLHYYEEDVPQHYNSGKDYDLIDVGINYKLNFFRFNVLKYICRAGKKEDELKDLEKALDYLQREIKYLKK